MGSFCHNRPSGAREVVHYTAVKPFRERRAFFNWRYIPKERRRGYKRWAVLLVLSIPAFFLFERHVLSAGRVTDVSMQPTLREGTYFLINKYTYHFIPPRRGDVVVLRPWAQTRWRYVKRVIGLGGETLTISSGRVYINDQLLEEPYAQGSTTPDAGPTLIPQGSCFVLGDNRQESEDSRIFGSVPADRIEGKIKPGRRLAPW